MMLKMNLVGANVQLFKCYKFSRQRFDHMDNQLPRMKTCIGKEKDAATYRVGLKRLQ